MKCFVLNCIIQKQNFNYMKEKDLMQIYSNLDRLYLANLKANVKEKKFNTRINIEPLNDFIKFGSIKAQFIWEMKKKRN